MTTARAVTVLAVLLALAPAPPRASADAGDAESALFAMGPAFARVTEYTARFARRERIDGTLRSPEEALLKWRRPGSIYLRWTAGPPAGREILFVLGRDDDRALIHEPGLISGQFTAVMAPDSAHVLRQSRHPITDVGIGRLVELILDNARRARERHELGVRDLPPSAPGLRRLELTVPRAAAGRYYARRVVVSLDRALGLPVAARITDTDGQLLADYAYRDVDVTPGLTAADFDPDNPHYRFPRRRLHL